MILSPEDHRLRKVLRDLVSENMRSGEQKVMFIDHNLEVREVVYEPEIAEGGHLRIRDVLLAKGELRAILHLGLYTTVQKESQRLARLACIHVVDPDADQDRPVKQQLTELLCLRQANNRVYWVPVGIRAQEAWAKSWFPDQ